MKRRLPLPPVKQRAADDIEVTVTFANGCREIHYYRPGAVEYLATRYAGPTAETGQDWQVTVNPALAGPNENGE